MYSALSGALAQTDSMKVTVNNLANVGNVGFKSCQEVFESYLKASEQTERSEGVNYVTLSEKVTDFSQGKFKKTDRTLDFSIQGQGFFKVAGEEGFMYTRKGIFRLDQDNNLITLDGHQVIGENGPIILPGTNVHVDQKGQIWSENNELLGELTVYDFENLKDLKRVANGYWIGQEASQSMVQENASVYQGVLEEANFSPLLVSQDLISLNRSFGAFMKTLQSYGEMSKNANEIGKIS
jgi:flagellar basal-body rod protein FlgG